MDKRTRVTEAADGRTLACAEWGDLTGSPVFGLHGTPGCRLEHHPDDELVRSTGARVITYDRPGYGGSDRHRGRTVADCAGDVAAIADSLGIGRFAVFGASGGGPHALAVAALLGDRVTRAACVVGVAPYEALGDDFFTGMDPENIKEFGWALEGEERLVTELGRKDEERRQRVAADPATLLDIFDLPESDRKFLAREDFAEVIRESAIEATRNGVGGWVDDDLAFISPWGFDPSAIAVLTQVWYGTRDVMVPPGHGEWIARTVPGAIVKLNELGHMGDPDADLVERHGWLTARTPGRFDAS
jgi:pimeloyl-ACP methyl ester carboxylesterase